MELLAPAGNRDHFFAAIEAGADAVYCGLTAFNARLRAKNMTPAMLSSMVAYARKKSV